MRKYKRGLDWHVVAPDGTHLNLNTEEGADTVIGLWETIFSLEAQLKRRRGRRKKGSIDLEMELDEALE